MTATGNPRGEFEGESDGESAGESEVARGGRSAPATGSRGAHFRRWVWRNCAGTWAPSRAEWRRASGRRSPTGDDR